MKILLAVAASLALLVSPSWAKHGGGGGGSHHHSKSNSGNSKGGKDKEGKGGKTKEADNDKGKSDSKDNPLATFLNAVVKKQN